MSNFKSIITTSSIVTVAAASLLLNACGSDSASSAAALSLVTVSGGTHTLAGTYDSGCYGTGGGANGQQDVLVVSGTSWEYTGSAHAGDVTCTNAAALSVLAGSLSLGATTATASWIDGGAGTTPPTADDLSGLLSNNEPITVMTLTLTATPTGDFTGAGVIGDAFSIFYVIDDTTTGKVVLYRDDDATAFIASSVDPFIQ